MSDLPVPDPDDPFSPGTVITVDHPLYAMVTGWKILEDGMVEMGLPRERAEINSKVLVARLTQNDPPILLCTPNEMKDE